MSKTYIVIRLGGFWKIECYDGPRISMLDASFSHKNDASIVAVKLQMGLMKADEVKSMIDQWVPKSIESDASADPAAETGYEGKR